MEKAWMKALVRRADGRAELTERPVPQLQEPRDAIVRVTLSTICTSDLHILRGAVPRANPDIVLGHEFVGVVEEVGEAVHGLRPGDRVAANCITFCGDCWFCRRGFINNCEHGGWELGCRIDGCQAEYVRVPFADTGLTKIPDSVTDESALFLGDILASGYFGAELCKLCPGDSVAVVGAGPVGLCAMACARLFGAARVIALDVDPFRLERAAKLGLADFTVNPREQDAERAVRGLTEGRGADGVVEAAGGADSLETAWRIARPNACVALIAMYEENQTLPLPSMYGKNLIFKTGGVDAIHSSELMRLMEAGRLDASFLITHKAPLNRILEGYRVFENREDGCLKWAVTPWEEE
ncbi:MAG TPA: alcohol dehydrogenase catalytic domain-containing protein [Candidatus Caccousia stercoris]|mgnify:CR=1 FL=1|uniref:Alcohol dehydrogenase catalytic domain-containing protein n=1 Tax=Candidatus Caccousia stercoris TaxID=2840723 RepID=A0A9D1FQD7_9FIRM|nr:alcohol dehydrogenase catalytic domain-containing protein [Candidatus Caccousia stercoris]